MTKPRLALGLAVLACTLAGSSAAALAVEFRDTVSPDMITAKQSSTTPVQTFTIGTNLLIECSEFEGVSPSTTSPTSSLPLDSLVYSSCKGKVLGVTISKVAVTTHNCSFLVMTGSTLENGTVDIKECPEAEPIEVKAAGCTVTITNQTGLSAIAFTNSSGTVLAKASVTPITQTNTCGITGKVTYKGEFKAKGSGEVSVS
jgi:hypothetical protein